ncbi:Virus X resistance protein-like, coiled-coil domain [Sesbania bispinosa]|nr:Virus X resistance protein-like, coiled-coil domain [Sesbania bispinosa]
MAVEFVGSALLSSFLQVAFDRLASTDIVDYFRGRKLNEKLLNKLNIMLLSIGALVDDAEQKQIRNPRMKAWVDAVKDAVFDAEDLLDEIDIHVSQCKLEAESQSSSSKVWNLFNASVSVSSFNDKEIESRMQEILDNLEYLASQKDILGLKEAGGFGVGSGRQVSQKLPSTSFLVESVIYGRDDDKEIIFNCLKSDTENDNQLSIISVVGMGGMGKTTLAQHLYNDPRIEGEFDIKAWVCVSDEFDVFRITRAILEAITRSSDDTRDLNMLQVKLKENLIGKKFLLVLDDVWNQHQDKWEALQAPLKFGAQGSKILVTTRNPEFKEIAIKLIEKCKGLPLALKTIGSLIYTTDILEWESILKSEIWDLPEKDSNIIPALMLSYYHLPSHLKRCFAYCSLFPKDFVFEKEHLVLLWMAENFLQCPQQSKSVEEVGEQYFDELLSSGTGVRKMPMQFGKLKNLQLELGWSTKHDDSEKEREVLEKLQPSKHLKELSIREYGGTRFPDWFGDNSLSNVVSLQLINCKYCVWLPPLGLLSSLKELWIEGLHGIKVIGSEFYGNGSSTSSIPFPSLETLEFKHMEGWECNIMMGVFPCLRELSIENCPKLKEHLPYQLPCLEKLRIFDCQELVASLPRAPKTLKVLEIGRLCMEGSLLERIGHTISDSSLEELLINDHLTMNIPTRHCYNFLVKIRIRGGCDSLKTFPLDIFPKLQSLWLEECSNLEMISQKHSQTSLTDLRIGECPKFVLPKFVFPSLAQLRIRDCPQVESFSDGGLPPKLKLLFLWSCSQLLIVSLKWALATNTCLRGLVISGVDVESFPDEGLLPLSLASLHILNCPNLKNWTTWVSVNSLLLRTCLYQTALHSKAYQRRVSPNPFQLYQFWEIVCCSNSVAKNQMVKTGGRFLTFHG